MTLDLVFLLEDCESDSLVFKLRFEALGLNVKANTNVHDAIDLFNKTGDVYRGYFLDMKLPFYSGEEPSYHAGLEVRRHLISKGVNPDKIFLMSTGISHNDESAAKEYGVSPKQIIGKDQFTEKTLKELLSI